MLILSLVTLFAVFWLLMSQRSDRVWLLSPSSLFALFMMFTWGPSATLFIGRRTHIEDVTLNNSELNKFYLIYILGIGFVGLFYWLANFIVGKSKVNGFKLLSNEKSFVARNPNQIWIFVFVAVLILSCYVIDGTIRRYLFDTYSYYMGSNVLSYKEIRRETLYGGAYDILFSRLNYSLVFLVFCCLIRHSVILGKHWWMLFLALLLYLVCGISLKKMSPIWFFFGAGAMVTISIIARFSLIRQVMIATSAVLLLLASTFILYKIQYRDYDEVTNERLLYSSYPEDFFRVPGRI